MSKSAKPVFATAALVALASVSRGQVRFDVYVALGDSLTAGVVSGSLVETRQRNSFPAQIARAAGITSFEQPTVSEPGIPPELQLLSLSPGPVVVPKASSPGSPTNLALPRPYNNLGVPGADVLDMLSTVTDGGGAHDLVLRRQGTALQQAAALQPTLITLWIGANDVLGAVLAGRAIEGLTLTSVEKFRARYEEVIASAKATGATVVAADIPDPTLLPFVATIPPVVVDPATRQPVLVDGRPVPLIGPSGTLASNAHVLLTASTLIGQGIGIPRSLGGQGTPLPGSVILDADEAGAVRDHVAAYNLAIRELCGSASVPVVDVAAFFDRVATDGINVAGVHLSADFLTGGLFSYDGIHPTEIGYAVVANEWIAKINQNGAELPFVDLNPLLGVASARRAGPMEFSEEAFQNLLAFAPRLGDR
jgi:lysophospholipase L1-like esterase